ncbi:MAG: (d)CMP kinase [Clostridia bacterium]|nr:(d)CMP kinase [Clostridia bacterium]
MYSVAIDGPAGAGKSSVAKAVAAKLGFIYVDTGALYRTVALHLLKNNISADDVKAVEASLPNIEVSLAHKEDGQHVYLGGEDVSSLIRTPEVSMMASTSSAIPAVRKFLFSLQTGMAEKYNVIMDGRDIGTVVLPNAQAKIFLTASPEVRAKRRYDEYIAKGEDADYEAILKDVIQRDYQDMNRETAPLKPAKDGVIVDSSDMSFDEVVEKLTEIVRSVMTE